MHGLAWPLFQGDQEPNFGDQELILGGRLDRQVEGSAMSTALRLAQLCAAHLLMVSMGWLGLHGFPQGI